ncbi:MAG TPA: tRNA pseudouridine(38-40) synthase TruA [bacterium]|nr:tRNA pseudouridine(38-40) synthase TruA [bacterium]HPN43621.1 tRNA pseudouridine(38-40) synthase TruA [bacterium]
MMRNLKLEIEYDGTDFCGWQIQPEVRTVQAEMEKALLQLTNEIIRVTAAGRTDSGVHATGQVINFKTASHLPDHVFRAALNSMLPRDIRVVSAVEVDEEFSARFSARSRTYRYYIINKPVAIGRQYTWYFGEKLNLSLMQEACRIIIDSHDFQSFCQVGADVDHYLCNVSDASWRQENDNLLFEITANRFLHNMVRILVGTLVKIGKESITLPQFQAIINAKDRTVAGPTAPPQGLFLTRVMY